MIVQFFKAKMYLFCYVFLRPELGSEKNETEKRQEAYEIFLGRRQETMLTLIPTCCRLPDTPLSKIL